MHARLHVLLARDAPVGVIIRRGPARAVCTVGWDREKDKFILGQWLRGRIYERRSDLSPDAKHLIYFAMGGKRHTETKGTWTAISRTPWLKAVTLFGKGDAWQGGGLFTSNEKFWLNGCHFPVIDGKEVISDEKHKPVLGFGAECLSVYFPRLLRDGWKIEAEVGPHRACVVFTKDLPHGWALRKFAHAGVDHPQGTGMYWDEHELEHREQRALLACKKWEWADRDGADLVWAEGGVLWRARLSKAGPEAARALMNFNEMKFEALAAPY